MEALNKGGMFMVYAMNKSGAGYIVENGEIKNVTFHEYIADSFEDLPAEGPSIGDRALFVEDGKIAIAMYFTTGWVKG